MIYEFSRMVCRWYLSLVGKWKVYGQENLPANGGVIIASNHVSNLDPVIMGCTFDRRVSYLAKEELFKNPIFGWYISKLEAFPIKRGAGDRGAIRESLKILESGRCFGIFPEGTRSRTGELQEGKAGAAMLALKAKVPVLPVGIKGSGQGKNIIVRVGKPMYFDEYYDRKATKEDLEEITGRIMKEIRGLLERE
ncbi:MAG: lysophospholipid acyltransferase family protein [Clostridia bacterium]|nr:lysophospholipid acyltransferase family protein [Clostridia bacterium]